MSEVIFIAGFSIILVILTVGSSTVWALYNSIPKQFVGVTNAAIRQGVYIADDYADGTENPIDDELLRKLVPVLIKLDIMTAEDVNKLLED